MATHSWPNGANAAVRPSHLQTSGGAACWTTDGVKSCRASDLPRLEPAAPPPAKPERRRSARSLVKVDGTGTTYVPVSSSPVTIPHQNPVLLVELHQIGRDESARAIERRRGLQPWHIGL